MGRAPIDALVPEPITMAVLQAMLDCQIEEIK